MVEVIAIFSRSPSRLMAPATIPFISWDSKTATGSSAPLSSRMSTRLRRSPRSEPTVEFLPQSFHGRRLVQEAPLWADVTELVLPAFVARLPHRGVGAPGRPTAQARGCACSYTRRSRSFET